MNFPFAALITAVVTACTPLATAGGLTKSEAQSALDSLWMQKRAALAGELRGEMANKEIVWQGKRMRWLELTFGAAPPGGRSLWISLHGGGGAPAEVNDGQWQNQIKLYRPAEGIVVAPRAPTDTWNLWHEGHIDPMLDRLIAGFIATRGVDPDRVYLLGYSAGGDGVYQLAPRAADRWAAAAMMAGHPNESKPAGLRNLPFFIFTGAEDSGYNRNRVAADWGKQLDDLQKADPGGYPHRTTLYPGLGHWMNGNDREALPLMGARTRKTWPEKVVWLQDDVTHDRLYWLAVPKGTAVKDRLIRASIDGQTITIESSRPGNVILRLSDALLDLDKPVRVSAAGRTIFAGIVPRTTDAIRASLNERPDPRTAATATIEVPIATTDSTGMARDE